MAASLRTSSRTMASRNTGDERIERLREAARSLPAAPGVYVFRSSDGEEIYVGKAADLKARVRSYFDGASGHDPRTAALVAEIDAVDVYPADSEVDALLLENRMIKELQPRFNVNLRDSKSYPYLVITWSEDFPRVYLSREAPRAGERFYGPFVSAHELRAAINHLQ
ncbi:MAG TPA: excinuclease ABC subunit UvrC, partial [Planctomycetes bacterium]|nr:excinuclease ABC subunit UvrC [Planctomycetota bacterium]